MVVGISATQRNFMMVNTTSPYKRRFLVDDSNVCFAGQSSSVKPHLLSLNKWLLLMPMLLGGTVKADDPQPPVKVTLGAPEDEFTVRKREEAIKEVLHNAVWAERNVIVRGIDTANDVEALTRQINHVLAQSPQLPVDPKLKQLLLEWGKTFTQARQTYTKSGLKEQYGYFESFTFQNKEQKEATVHYIRTAAGTLRAEVRNLLAPVPSWIRGAEGLLITEQLTFTEAVRNALLANPEIQSIKKRLDLSAPALDMHETVLPLAVGRYHEQVRGRNTPYESLTGLDYERHGIVGDLYPKSKPKDAASR